MEKQIRMFFPTDNAGMDGGGTDGGTGLADTGGFGSTDLNDAADDGGDVGADDDLGDDDDLRDGVNAGIGGDLGHSGDLDDFIKGGGGGLDDDDDGAAV